MLTSRSPRATSPRGIALPIALAAIVVVGALIAGVFFAATQEYRSGSGAITSQRTLQAAESGVHSVLSSWTGDRTTGTKIGQSVRLADTTIDGVSVRRQFTKVSTTVFWVTATATAGSFGAQQRSVKRVNTIVRIETPDFKVAGAMTARGDMILAGNGSINGTDSVPGGFDDCPPAGAPTAGIVVGDSVLTTTSTGNCVSGPLMNDFTCVTGDPKVKDSTALVKDTTTFTNFGGFNYDSLTKLANRTYTGGTLPSGLVQPITTAGACDVNSELNWGDTLATPPSTARGPCKDYFPIIWLKGDAAIWTLAKQGGQGIILVDGNLKMAGQWQWTGIVLAKGWVRIDGGPKDGPRILGAVMAMNARSVPDTADSYVKGLGSIRFSRCAIMSTMAKRARAAPTKYRAWADMSF